MEQGNLKTDSLLPQTSLKTLQDDKTIISESQYILHSFDNVRTVSLPSSNQVLDTIYGLWNRFFPVKITVRVLANMLEGNGETVSLELLQENASNAARELGTALLKKEKNLGRKRGERLSTALPTKRNEYKARMRFKSHFVGYLSKNRIEGMPATLRLINIFKDDSERLVVGLTTLGLQFAKLENPILDKNDFNMSLSADEKHFLLGVINSKLPKEANDIHTVLKVIASGASDPKELSRQLATLKSELVKNELITFQSGILSRLFELGLIRRTSSGVSNKYESTTEGEKLFKES